MNVNGFPLTSTMHSTMQNQFPQDFTQQFQSIPSMQHNQWQFQQQTPFNPAWNQQPMQNIPLQNGIQPPQNAAIQAQQPSQHALASLNTIPYISPQLMQDALRMSTPVGSNPMDENIMVQILYESPMAGQTYKQALDSLHGINNHAASLWKDYYLDHKPRIDRLVAERAEQNGHVSAPSQSRTIQAPRIHDLKAPSPPPQRDKPRKTHHKERPQTVLTSKPTKRATINSLTTHIPPQSLPKNLTPPQAHIVIPRPPSRSPTPPTTVVRGTRGNKYTQQDKDYFIKFIGWRLKCNPELTKADLCALLAEKAPHHTAQSWQSHWHSRHELADKILAVAVGDPASNSASESVPTDRSNFVPSLHRNRHNSFSGSCSVSDASGSDESDSGSEWHQNSDFEDEDTDYDVKNMGEAGSAATKADIRLMAKYVAIHSNWDSMTARERWEPFEEMYSQRSWKAWAEHYRRVGRKIDKIAKELKRRQGSNEHSRSFQQGGPTRVRPREQSPQDSVMPKRKADVEGFHAERNKRPRNELSAHADRDEGSDADAYGETDEDA